MDKLCGPESLPVVFHRFSDGVDVLKCVAGFIKEVGEVEQSYSNSLQKLIKSPLYEFHSNFIMQLIGSNPYEEIGTVKHTWSELGQQLSALATVHADKAKEYMNKVRQPLLDLTPQLEETRKEVKSKMRQLRDELEAASNKHLKTKTKYQQTADNVEKCWQKVSTGRSDSLLTANQKSYMKNNEKLAVLEAELSYQATVYREAQSKHLEAKEQFDRQVKELYRDIQAKETERVNTIKKSLQQFAKTLSNTVPTYLASMQHIVISMEQIDSGSDIEAFVEQHTSLMEQTEIPPFEQHPIAIEIEQKGSLSSVKVKNRHSLTKDVQENGVSTPTTDRDHLPQPTAVEQGVDRDKEGDQNTTSPPGPTKQADLKAAGKSQVKKPVKPSKPSTIKVQQKAVANGVPHSTTGAGGKVERGDVRTEVRAERGDTKAERGDVRAERNDVRAERGGVRAEKGNVRVERGDARAERSDVRAERGNIRAERTGSTGKVVSIAAKKEQKTASKPEQPPTPTSPKQSGNTVPTKPSPAPRRKLTQARESSKTVPSPTERSRTNSNPNKTAKQSVSQDDELQRLLSGLQVKARDNDYYGILRVNTTATEEELSKARRERTKELHPDHFTNDEEQKEIAQQELVLVNQVYQDVLGNSESRDLYNQLCAFRAKYHLILNQQVRGLQVAQEKLTELRKKLKRSRCPQTLLDELDTALQLTQLRITKLQDTPT